MSGSRRGTARARKRKHPEVTESNQNPPPANLPCANAASLVDQEVRWLWNRLVPFQDVTLLAGQTEVGKSTVATSLAAALTAGFKLPGGPDLPSPRSVLWYGTEESPSARIKPRLRAAGAVLDRVYFPELQVDGTARPKPRLPRDAHQVLALAQQLDAGLIVFDPITSYCEDGANPDHGTVARPVLECLREIAVLANAACLPIKHPKKYVPGASPLDQISGSKEWVNVPRSVLIMTLHPEQDWRRCLIQMKGNNGADKPRALAYTIVERDGVPVVVWEEEEQFTLADLLEGSGTEGERDALSDAKMLLIDRLTAGEQRAKDLLKWGEESAIGIHVLRKAKKLLKITSHTIGPVEARYHVWRAPEGGFRTFGA